MSYARRRGLGDAVSDATMNALVADGESPAQAATVTGLMQRTADGTTGNVPPQYANLVLHWDGTLGPLSDLSAASASDPNAIKIIAANRYLLILDANNNLSNTIGAVSIPAAQAILATYAAVPGSTSGQVQPTAATAAANANAAQENAVAQAANPVPVQSNVPGQVLIAPPGVILYATPSSPTLNVDPILAPPLNVTPATPVSAPVAPSFFSSTVGGIPVWLLGMGALGAFFMLRRRGTPAA